MTFYCGNNAKAPEVVSGQKKIGTAYECFRRGVGVGKHLPRSELEGEYEPIYSPNIFCGKKFGQDQKEKYERMGSPSECLRKGVGVGKGLARKEKGLDRGSPKSKPRKQYGFEETSESGMPRVLKPKFRFESSKESVWTKRFIISGVGLAIGFSISFGILWFVKPNFVKKDGKRSVLKITLYSLLFGFILALICLVGSVYFLK